MELQLLVYIFYLTYYLLFVTILFRIKVINSTLMLYFVIFSVTPFLTNGLLFDPSYMPDQFGYLSLIKDIRSFSYIPTSDIKIDSSAFILSIFPLPFIFDVIGVSFINKFIFTIAIAWLFKEKYISGACLWFAILYPDVVLYSSLALKDLLAMSIMLFGFIYLIRNNKVKSFLWFLPLYVIKFQNFFISIFFYMLYFINSKYKKTYSISNFYKLALLITVIVIISSYYFIDDLNRARVGMLILDGVDPDYITLLTPGYQLILDGIKGLIHFLLMPFIWEASGGFQILQSVINIFVILFLIAYSIKYYKLDKNKTLFWLIFLLFSMALHSVVISNFGTAARYRFPFIWIYVVILHVDILLDRNQSNSRL
jgi:hypothetical protein